MPSLPAAQGVGVPSPRLPGGGARKIKFAASRACEKQAGQTQAEWRKGSGTSAKVPILPKQQSLKPEQLCNKRG